MIEVERGRGSRGKVRSIRLSGVTGRGDVKEVEICCIPARRERVHGVWSEYPLIHTNTLPEHYTLPIPCCGAPYHSYQYLISPDQDFSASHQYLVTQYQFLASPLHSTNTLLAVLNVKHYQYFSASHQYFFTQYQYLARYCTNTTLHRDNSLHSHLYL